MNIDKIIKEYPKAFEEMLRSRGIKFKEITSVKWYENTRQFFIVTDDRFAYFIYFRELYDYFDSVGIRVEVLYSNPYSAWYGLVNGKSDFHNDTRTEAEFPALEKGFEFREKQLRQHTDGINSNTIS